MAVRTPLINDSGNIKQMSSAQVDEIVDQVVYQYSLNPGVTLSVAGSGGNLSAMSDTRLQAGAASTSATSFPSEATTAEPSTVTVNYQRITSTNASLTPTADTGKTWPAYYNSSGHIQAMNLQDVKDTFLHPAIDLLTTGSTTTQQAGTYTIATSTSLSGATNVSSTAIYSDTRADTSAYTAGGIGETLDQPTTITNYYLHRVDGSNTSYTSPFFINASNNLQEFSTTTFNSLLQEWIRYTAASSTDGYAISYSIGTSGSGNTRGSGIVDTKLNGSGNYQQRFVNADDYRAQEFPNGTPTTINTYNLRIIKS
mgnify:CR=1 FL=1|tara:strand:- start:5639 stop:6574 length:936 start_codon:yes stop_codon:yes gene_type:complete